MPPVNRRRKERVRRRFAARVHRCLRPS